jgi:hypothetical protein
VTDWSGEVVALDPADPRRVVLRAAPAPGGAYHPTAIAGGGGALWTLDAAQARLVRESARAPERVLGVRPTPGPAPTALAFDGGTVWSYDAVDRSVTKHGGDDAPEKTWPLPDEAVPNAMAWSDGRLWVHDAKNRRILIYSVSDDGLHRVAAQPDPAPGVTGLVVAGSGAARRLVVLLAPEGGRAQAEIARYRMRALLPFARF